MSACQVGWNYIQAYLLDADEERFRSLFNPNATAVLIRKGQKVADDVESFLHWFRQGHFKGQRGGRITSLNMESLPGNKVIISLLSEGEHDIPPGLDYGVSGEHTIRVYNSISLTCDNGQIISINHEYTTTIVV